MIEVEEKDWQKARACQKLLDQIGSNPLWRRKFLELLKEMNPEFSIPEIDNQ